MRKDNKLPIYSQIMHITFSDLDTIKMKINARIRKQDYCSHQKSYYLREKKSKAKKKGTNFPL